MSKLNRLLRLEKRQAATAPDATNPYMVMPKAELLQVCRNLVNSGAPMPDKMRAQIERIKMNIQKTYHFVKPMNSVQNLQAQQQQVLRDVRMTPYEKQNAMQQLNAQRSILKTSVSNALKMDRAELKQEYQTLRREKIGAADRAANRWDFQRLEYSRTSAREFLSKASPEAIAKRYEQIELSGDNHALRGFVEEGINILGNEREFPTQDSLKIADLKQDFVHMQESLTVTPEMQNLAKQGEILTDKIHGFYQAVNQARAAFQPDMADLYLEPQERRIAFMLEAQQNDPFKDMTDGIHIKQTVDSSTLAIRTEVNLDWDTGTSSSDIAAQVRETVRQKLGT